MLGRSTPSGGSLVFLSSTRQVLLVAIKNNGEATTEELARETYLSPGAVRQHLLALEAKGLVAFFRLRSGPGRPRHVFRLTDRGEELFPQLYAEMANVLMVALEQEGDPALLERVFSRMVVEQVELAEERVYSKERPERLLQLSQFIERFGFFPRLDVPEDGSPALTLRHCPLLNLAKNHPVICEIERRAMSSILPGATIERIAHRLAGDALCTYAVHYEE